MASYLVFDTNGLPMKGNLESGFWTALFKLCAAAGITATVSEVVLDEAINLRRDAANKLLNPLVAAHTKLGEMTRVDAIYTPTGDEIAREYESRLRTLFEVLPLDGEHAREGLRREARRIVPARNGKGARDSAIWLQVAVLANGGHKVYFVTKNHKDFGDGGLFSELLAEVKDAAHPIEYLASPNDFVDLIATRIELPDITVADLADAFNESIRATVVGRLEAVESADLTVDRAWNSSVSIDDPRFGFAFVVEGQGLAHLRANVTLADPSGAGWAMAKVEGWINFDAETLACKASAADDLLDLTFA